MPSRCVCVGGFPIFLLKLCCRVEDNLGFTGPEMMCMILSGEERPGFQILLQKTFYVICPEVVLLLQRNVNYSVH